MHQGENSVEEEKCCITHSDATMQLPAVITLSS